MRDSTVKITHLAAMIWYLCARKRTLSELMRVMSPSVQESSSVISLKGPSDPVGLLVGVFLELVAVGSASTRRFVSTHWQTLSRFSREGRYRGYGWGEKSGREWRVENEEWRMKREGEVMMRREYYGRPEAGRGRKTKCAVFVGRRAPVDGGELSRGADPKS